MVEDHVGICDTIYDSVRFPVFHLDSLSCDLWRPLLVSGMGHRNRMDLCALFSHSYASHCVPSHDGSKRIAVAAIPGHIASQFRVGSISGGEPTEMAADANWKGPVCDEEGAAGAATH